MWDKTIEWQKSWKWGLTIYPRYCCCESYDTNNRNCKCDDDHPCTWREGPAAVLSLMIGPSSGDLEEFKLDITMEAVKNIYRHFHMEDQGFGYQPPIYAIKRRWIGNRSCTEHTKPQFRCPACRRLVNAEKKEQREEKQHKEYKSKHSEEMVLREMMLTRKAWEEKRQAEQ